MRKISRFSISTFFALILVFSTAQITSFSVPQVSHSETSDVHMKFDVDFEKKTNDMMNSGETREYGTIIVVKKAAESGLSAQQVAEKNKNRLVDALTNIHHAKILYKGQKLSFVTANIPLNEISKLANYDYVVAIGDGEASLQPQSLNMDDAKFNIDVPTNLSYNGSGVKVAVIDTGIAQNLTQDLPVGPKKIIEQADCTSGTCLTNGSFNDILDHGTHNAGIIGGLGIVSSGMKGVAPGALLLNVKIGTNALYLPPALDWALLQNARIANISAGIGPNVCNIFSTTTTSLITDEAVDEGLVVVAAAGNVQTGSANNGILSPACAYNTIAVGAVDDYDTRTQSDDTVWTNHPVGGGSSARGPVGFQKLLKPDLIAPGVRINATDFCTQGNAYHTPYNLLNYFRNSACQLTANNSPYGNFTGTSHAAPFISGAAALLLQAHPEYSPLQVKAALLLGANWTGNIRNGNFNNATATASMYETNWKQYNSTLSARGFGLVDVNKTLTYANSGKNIVLDTIQQGQAKNYTFSATQGNQVKVILSWLKHPLGNVTYPTNIQISNLDFYITRTDTGQSVISSTSKNQTNEFAVFNAPATVTYTIKVTAPYEPSSIGNSETFALASTQSLTKGSFFVKEGTFTKATATGLQTITGLGFKPKALLLFTTGQSTSGFSDNYTQTIGFSNGTNSRSIGISSDGNTQDISITGRSFGTKVLTIPSSGTPTIMAEADLTSLRYNNFTLNWTTNNSVPSLIHYVALGGADLTNVAVSSFNANTRTGVQSVIGMGFQPDFVMFMHANSTSETSTASDAYLSYGFYTITPASRGATAVTSENGKSPTATASFQRSDRVIVTLNSATGAVDGQADILSMDPNGFSINWINAPTSAGKIYYLALQGGQYQVGSFAKPTSSAPVTQLIPDVGFQPKGVILTSINTVASTTVQPNNRLSFGAADGSNQSAIWSGDTNNVGNSIAVRSDTTSKVIRLATEASPSSSSTINAEANLVSMNTTGFTINWTTNDAIAKQILYVAFGSQRLSNLVIVEQTRPTSTTIFSYTNNVTPFPFFLENNGSRQQYPDTQVFSNVKPGTYWVSQGSNSAYLTTSSCSNGDPVSSIHIGNNQTVICKFVNTKPSTIKIIEKTVPKDSTVFQFTSKTLTPSPFTLYDNNTGHNSTKFINLQPGIYDVNETANSGYKTIFLCNDNSPVSAINLGINKTITCTSKNQHIPAVATTITVGTNPYWDDVNPNTNRIYVANFGSNNVSVINGTNTVIATIAVGTSPDGIAVNPNTNKIYVANYGTSTNPSNTVNVINGTTNTVIATITVGTGPIGVAVNPNTNKIYVANYGTSTTPSNTVSVIDGATNTVTATITVGTGPVGVAVNPNTNKIYVANFGGTTSGQTISVIDGATNTVTATIAVGVNPFGVAVNPNTNKIYVTNYNTPGQSISVIDGATNTVTATITAGINNNPNGVAVDPNTNRIYVANLGANTVNVIDGDTNTVIATVAVGFNPFGVAVNPNTDRIYVANYGSTTVSVISG